MLLLPLLLSLFPLPVRAEPVEALSFLSEEKSGPSTSSGRTEVGNQTPIDAERAFAADAQTLGQWTAFAKWSTDDAVMFVPHPTNAHAWLKDRKDPAKAIDWWPTASYISCDGKYAVNTGGWRRPDGSVGYFTTVWHQQPDGQWRWLLDRGDTSSTAREKPAEPIVRRASCENTPNQRGYIIQGMVAGGGPSDFSLSWYMRPERKGVMRLGVMLWNGKALERVLADDIKQQ